MIIWKGLSRSKEIVSLPSERSRFSGIVPPSKFTWEWQCSKTITHQERRRGMLICSQAGWSSGPRAWLPSDFNKKKTTQLRREQSFKLGCNHRGEQTWRIWMCFFFFLSRSASPIKLTCQLWSYQYFLSRLQFSKADKKKPKTTRSGDRAARMEGEEGGGESAAGSVCVG